MAAVVAVGVEAGDEPAQQRPPLRAGLALGAFEGAGLDHDGEVVGKYGGEVEQVQDAGFVEPALPPGAEGGREQPGEPFGAGEEGFRGQPGGAQGEAEFVGAQREPR